MEAATRGPAADVLLLHYAGVMNIAVLSDGDRLTRTSLCTPNVM